MRPDLDIRASATVERGVTTNRVVVSNRKPRKPRAYRRAADHGNGFKVICVSLPPRILALIDESASAIGMCRSEFMRTAALQLAVSLRTAK